MMSISIPISIIPIEPVRNPMKRTRVVATIGKKAKLTKPDKNIGNERFAKINGRLLDMMSQHQKQHSKCQRKQRQSGK